MSTPDAVIERFAEERTVLRSAILRGHARAVHRVLERGGPRGATLLAWVALAARPGTALADRIDEAAIEFSSSPSVRRNDGGGRGSALLELIRGDDMALMAFSRGMAVLQATEDDTGDMLRPRIAEWHRHDPASLSDFALVGLIFGVTPALPEILDALGPGAPALLLSTPRLSRRALGVLCRLRPQLIWRLISFVQSSGATPTCTGRLIDLLHRLAAASPDEPAEPGGRTAIQRLALIARDRDETVDRMLRGPALAALDDLGWSAVVPVVGEVLNDGLVSSSGDDDELFAETSERGQELDDLDDGVTVRDRRLTVEEAAGEAERLMAILARHRSPAAIDLLDRVGRRHRLASVRCAALEHLIAATGAARAPAPPGRAVGLARTQLGDPIDAVVLPALDHLRRGLSAADLGRAILRAIPTMSVDAVEQQATRLAWNLPLELHAVAVRRLVACSADVALLKFLVAASHRTRGPDLFTGVEREDPAARTQVDEVELRGLDALVESWLERLDHCLRPLIRDRIRWWSSSELPISNGLPAEGWSDHGMRLVRLAARHGGRDAQESAPRHRLHEHGAAGGSGDEPTPRPVHRSSDLVQWTILHALRGDRSAARLRVQLLARGIERGVFRPRLAVSELAGMQALPPTADLIDIDRWRSLLRRTLAAMDEPATPLLWACAGPDESHHRLTPWLMGELVALHAGSDDPGTFVFSGMPRHSTEPHRDRAFRTRPPLGMTVPTETPPSVAVHMHCHLRGVLRWLEREGSRLLDQPVHVRLTAEGAGHTAAPIDGAPPTIHVSPDPMIDLGPCGTDVMRGVGIHEFGHQLYDFREPGQRREHQRVQRLGLATLQNLLCDERLERRLRSRSRIYGTLIDTAIGHHFHRQIVTVPLSGLAMVSGRNIGELRSAIAGGIMPRAQLIVDREADCEELRVPCRDLLRLPGLGTPWQVFSWGLRAGVAPADIPCGRARAALALVPTGLKDLTLRQIGGVCERVAEVLGGVEDERARRRAMRQLSRQAWEAAEVLRAAGLAAGGAWAAGARTQGSEDGPIAGVYPGMRSSDAAVAHRRDRLRRLHQRRSSARRTDSDAPETSSPPLPFLNRPPREDAAHRALMKHVQSHVAVLRRAFDRIGVRSVDEPASRRGHRLDLARARRMTVAPSPTVLVSRREVPAADCHLGILIDRSGSMHGPKIHQARCFGAMVAEAARHHRGIDGWVAAFDDDTWFDLGGFRDTSVATLRAGGGNNDAAALMMAGHRMRRSRRRRRILVLISDGQPTECSVADFHHEADCLERDHGIAVIHVVIEQMSREAVLPRSVDLAGEDHEAAVHRFAGMVAGLVRAGRRAVAIDEETAAEMGRAS